MATPINSTSVTTPVTTPQSSSDRPAGTSAPPLPGASSETTAPVQRQPAAASGSPTPVSTSSAARESTESAEELAQATRDISDYIQTVSRSLQISVDRDLGSTIIRVLDTDTDELIRQIPSEEVLEIARYIAEQRSTAGSSDPIRGLLIDGEG